VIPLTLTLVARVGLVAVGCGGAGRAYDSDPLDRRLKLQLWHRADRAQPGDRSKTQDGRKLRRYKRRWCVLFAWLQWFRRLVRRYEYHIGNYLGIVRLGLRPPSRPIMCLRGAQQGRSHGGAAIRVIAHKYLSIILMPVMSGGEQAAMGQSGFMRPVVVSVQTSVAPVPARRFQLSHN
jgi:hypothetical protein